MPNFIKTPKDEAKWSKAKAAAAKSKKKDEGSFTDQDWALTNHIYQEMGKSIEFAKNVDHPSYIQAMIHILEKARQKMSDEYDPNDISDDDNDLAGLNEFNPDDEESTGEDWLKENDPESKGSDYDEYDESEDEDAHQKAIEEDLGDEGEDPAMDEAGKKVSGMQVPAAASKAGEQAQTSPQSEVKRSRFEQPSREDLMAMRTYTRPWEQRARETTALKADPSKNPELARHGNIVEARNQAHGDRNAAYREFINSPEYKAADPIAQMEMDDKFESDWKAKNPEHLKTALQAHDEAHKKGEGNRDLHAAGKNAAIENIVAGGGHGGGGYSLEEGLQHAGGAKGEEGTQGTIVQDPAAGFAMGNQDFIKQFAKDRALKNKKVGNIDDMMQHDEGSKRDIARILGEGPNKDPKFEKFFAHYHPLIGMSAHKTLNRLGLDPKHPDIDMSMLHEAGMHGLIQAMNDYDHDNPAKASFATHAGNKIRGLQMTAMRNQDAIPAEVRQAQKKFAAKGQEPIAPKVDLHSMISSSGHPAAADISDRLKRVGAAKAAATIRRPAGTPKPPQMPTPKIEEEE